MDTVLTKKKVKRKCCSRIKYFIVGQFIWYVSKMSGSL